MNRIVDILLTDLRHLINELGKDGGLISPSVYDTAQVVRMAPPMEGVGAALNWLLEQQQPDGGWGDPAAPRARDVPTLAAVLALHTCGSRAKDKAAARAGLAFIRRQSGIWQGALPDDLPVGVELILPSLLEEVTAAGMNVPSAPYAALITLGRRRRRLIAQMRMRAGTPLAHSWEALEMLPELAILDESRSVGHSPAATAAWLHATAGRVDLIDARAAAIAYLERAAAATGVGIPGVVPTAWPLDRFEQAFALYMLLIAGLMDHPALMQAVKPQIGALARAMRPTGLGFSDSFLPDGDDTAAALAVLQAAKQPIDLDSLRHFAAGDHFCAYAGELQPSISVTARAAHVLALLGAERVRPTTYLVERQQADGRWSSDKWNASWLYTTCQAVIALVDTEHTSTLARATDVLLIHQHRDGGWGQQESTSEETAYGILTLRALHRARLLNRETWIALDRAEQWMRHNYRPFHHNNQTCWLAKALYRPHRIARMIELAATFPTAASEAV